MIENRAEPTDSGWRALYVVGAVAALVTVLNGVIEIAITFFPGGGMSFSPVTAVDWFTLFQSSRFLGLRNLGLLNIFFTCLSIPVFCALYSAHRRTHQAFAGLSMIVAFIGVTVFLGTNRAFPMLALTDRYAAATTDVQRSALAAAGEAMLAVGQSHTPGTLLAFLLSSAAGVGISIVMLLGKVFNKATAIIGIIGFALLLIFELTSDLAPGFSASFLFAISGGPLSMVWDLLIALRLFQLAAGSRE
jgi:hypothetical protein